MFAEKYDEIEGQIYELQLDDWITAENAVRLLSKTSVSFHYDLTHLCNVEVSINLYTLFVYTCMDILRWKQKFQIYTHFSLRISVVHCTIILAPILQ